MYNPFMDFQRLLEFCSTVYAQTPQNDIRAHLPNALRQAPQAFEAYEQSLIRLDTPTWEYVKQKRKSNLLPLKDLFINRKIEFGFSLQNIQTVFETLKIQPIYS